MDGPALAEGGQRGQSRVQVPWLHWASKINEMVLLETTDEKVLDEQLSTVMDAKEPGGGASDQS